MRNIFADKIYELSKKNNKIHVVVADISPAGSIEKFRRKYPKRFINVGVSEQVMAGISAGLALSGKKPFIYTIAAFVLYRPFEMIRDDICYQNLPVTIVGMGSGTIYSTLGCTHMTQEDISIARSVPNMQIISPCDPFELKEAIKFCSEKSKRPTYLRIGKSGEKNYSKKNSKKFEFGKIRNIIKGKKICFLVHGVLIKKVFEACEILNKQNINPSVYSCHTLKPFDNKRIKKIFSKYKLIVTLEDHSIIGGLSEIVNGLAFKNKYKYKIINFSLKDSFIDSYGSHDDILNKHGISTNKILKKLKAKIE